MRFVKYMKDYEPEIQQYVLTDDQLLYTASPQEALLLADKERHEILAYEDDLFVSFFVLHEGQGPKAFKGEDHAILMRTFSTDQRYLGRGYGTKIIKILPEYVKENFPNATSIILAVNEDNARAKRLYLKNGFEDNGKRMQGSRGNLIILEYYL